VGIPENLYDQDPVILPTGLRRLMTIAEGLVVDPQTVLGLFIAILARTPWKWLVVLWAIHLPTFVVLIGIPGSPFKV
jgi:hypothetical protein